mmetsp:Transcript_29541/g.45058  ORF Transcript_29541/g.45058 Transcript_29541/m.45058 type:complete len:80 (-) Transcript_29541:49-288(-)
MLWGAILGFTIRKRLQSTSFAYFFRFVCGHVSFSKYGCIPMNRFHGYRMLDVTERCLQKLPCPSATHQTLFCGVYHAEV